VAKHSRIEGVIAVQNLGEAGDDVITPTEKMRKISTGGALI
jgi:hypothetical protein